MWGVKVRHQKGSNNKQNMRRGTGADAEVGLLWKKKWLKYWSSGITTYIRGLLSCNFSSWNYEKIKGASFVSYMLFPLGAEQRMLLKAPVKLRAPAAARREYWAPGRRLHITVLPAEEEERDTAEGERGKKKREVRCDGGGVERGA